MFSFQVNLGQLVIVASIASIGWFIKHTISDLGNRLDDHEERLYTLTSELNRLIGRIGMKL